LPIGISRERITAFLTDYFWFSCLYFNVHIPFRFIIEFQLLIGWQYSIFKISTAGERSILFEKYAGTIPQTAIIRDAMLITEIGSTAIFDELFDFIFIVHSLTL
jgi:hypothetical protein